MDIHCKFKDYGDVERICVRCGYVIPKTNNDTQALKTMIDSGYPKPDCKTINCPGGGMVDTADSKPAAD